MYLNCFVTYVPCLYLADRESDTDTRTDTSPRTDSDSVTSTDTVGVFRARKMAVPMF